MTAYRQPQTYSGGISRVPFPNALRNDGRADTYVDKTGGLWLVPTRPEEHDFAFSESMHRERLSAGWTARLLGRQAIRYTGGTDLITLPAVVNAVRQFPEGSQDVTRILELIGKTSHILLDRLGRLPVLHGMQDIGFDRTADRIELLAPFLTDTALKPIDLFGVLEHDAQLRTAGWEESGVINDSFARARKFFVGDDHETHE